MIVTIDGPAGAGKSTVARRLARRLGFEFLDTGAMYRAVTLAALRAGLQPGSPELDLLIDRLEITAQDDRTFLDGNDVTESIRAPAVTAAVRHFADVAGVRERLGRRQRAFAVGRNLVTEGRDQGTVVFPNAECKLFLTASAEQRAKRRLADLASRGHQVPLATLIDEQQRRDEQDQNRTLAPLRPAPDAVIVDATELDLDGVVDRLERIVRARLVP